MMVVVIRVYASSTNTTLAVKAVKIRYFFLVIPLRAKGIPP